MTCERWTVYYFSFLYSQNGMYKPVFKFPTVLLTLLHFTYMRLGSILAWRELASFQSIHMPYNELLLVLNHKILRYALYKKTWFLMPLSKSLTAYELQNTHSTNHMVNLPLPLCRGYRNSVPHPCSFISVGNFPCRNTAELTVTFRGTPYHGSS
jgi:hypothetical protein